MVVRVVVAVTLFALLAVLAWWLERRRLSDAPMQTPGLPPTQLDRADFPRPEVPWLVVLFTSSTCESCFDFGYTRTSSSLFGCSQ